MAMKPSDRCLICQRPPLREGQPRFNAETCPDYPAACMTIGLLAELRKA